MGGMVLFRLDVGSGPERTAWIAAAAGDRTSM
jgi:hypothetical protein